MEVQPRSMYVIQIFMFLLKGASTAAHMHAPKPPNPQIEASWLAQVQKVCYAHEGTLNKFLIDDKGMCIPQHVEPIFRTGAKRDNRI